MKLRILTAAGFLTLAAAAVFILALTATPAQARDPVPAPYTGLKNPFPWTDPAAQAKGKAVYDGSCAGCHGPAGSGIASANFAAAGFAGRLESEADYFYYVVSEGILKNGMPPYKSSLSDEQRWQVVTYMYSLVNKGPAASAPTLSTPSSGGTITVAVDDNYSSRQGIVLEAALKDENGKPLSGEKVSFFIAKQFFATDWMEIGEAKADATGKASLRYLPSEDGQIKLAARSGGLNSESVYTVRARARGYQTEAGIRLPAIGPEVAIGLDVSGVEFNESPTGGFRLPGGTLSWLLLFVGVILLVWSTYFRVFRQVMHITSESKSETALVRLLPLGALVFVLLVGGLLAFVLLHGPYTHLQLAR